MLIPTWYFPRRWIHLISLVAVVADRRLKLHYAGSAPACCWLVFPQTGSFRLARCDRLPGWRRRLELEQTMRSLLHYTATMGFSPRQRSWRRSSTRILRKSSRLWCECPLSGSKQRQAADERG